ncbi:MAG TPA: riboflavin synthase [Puia sp.]|nr:riboflavin synthase [Puia sp.]
MFTGIIEAIGSISSISEVGTNKTFRISSLLAPHLRVDQSLSHDGVCLTVESVYGESYQVTAIQETLEKSNLGLWKEGGQVNLERCLQINGRLDGHMVQGHVDTTAVCVERWNEEGSWVFRFEFPGHFRNLVIEKGSVAVNGISLTCFEVTDRMFSVAIIPYTFENTNIREIVRGSVINIEFDLIGKYVERMMNQRKGA